MIVGPATVLMAFTLLPLRYEKVGLCCYVIRFACNGQHHTAIGVTSPRMFNASGAFRPTTELEPGSIIKLDAQQIGTALVMKAVLVIEQREWNPFVMSSQT
jgi:hypothetical protein